MKRREYVKFLILDARRTHSAASVPQKLDACHMFPISFIKTPLFVKHCRSEDQARGAWILLYSGPKTVTLTTENNLMTAFIFIKKHNIHYFLRSVLMFYYIFTQNAFLWILLSNPIFQSNYCIIFCMKNMFLSTGYNMIVFLKSLFSGAKKQVLDWFLQKWLATLSPRRHVWRMCVPHVKSSSSILCIVYNYSFHRFF